MDLTGSEVVVLLPETLNDLATGNLMLVVTDLLPAVGKSFPQKKDTDPILLNLGHRWLLVSLCFAC